MKDHTTRLTSVAQLNVKAALNMQHTQTRLTAFQLPNDRLQRWVLLGESSGTGKPEFAARIRRGVDARRLAACWNAFHSSVPTEEIERGNVAEQMHELHSDLVAADDFQQYLAAEVDHAPEPLRRLGEWLSGVLDEDEWKIADRMLLGAAIAANRTPAADADGHAEQHSPHCGLHE